MDAIYLGLGLVFFLAAWWLVAAFGKLQKGGTPS
jgi:hypothetical protein